MTSFKGIEETDSGTFTHNCEKYNCNQGFICFSSMGDDLYPHSRHYGQVFLLLLADGEKVLPPRTRKDGSGSSPIEKIAAFGGVLGIYVHI